MTNPFKVGDLVVEDIFHNSDTHKIGVAKVLQVRGQFVYVDKPSQNKYHIGATNWHYSNLRAAVNGQDYPLPAAEQRPVEYEGHLPDGSGIGSWFAPDGQRVNETVGQHMHIVDEHSPSGQLFVCALNKLVAAMHEHGEHTVLVRRLSGRGLVHFFLTKGQEVPLR